MVCSCNKKMGLHIMATAAHNTKIELVTEAFESLTLATCTAHAARSVNEKRRCHEAVVEARQGMRDALAELLTPTLRVVG